MGDKTLRNAVRDGETGIIKGSFNNMDVVHSAYATNKNSDISDTNELESPSLTPDSITNKQRAINLIKDGQPGKAVLLIHKTLEAAKEPQEIQNALQGALDIHAQLIDFEHTQDSELLMSSITNKFGLPAPKLTPNLAA